MTPSLVNEKPADAILVIDAGAKEYAEARRALAARVQQLEDELRLVRRKHIEAIKRLAGVASMKQAVLQSQIALRKDLFVNPRTMTLHGVKLGLQKGKGRIEWDDADKVVERIRAQYPKGKADALLDVAVTPSKTALLQLEAKELARLGCSIVGTEDAIVIKSADTEIDKLVARILEEGAKVQEGGAS